MKTTNLGIIVSLIALCFISPSAARASDNKAGPPTIEIHAKKFAYIPAEVTLRKGETYNLHLTSDDVPHSFRIKALNLNSKMKRGEFDDVLFTPEKTGDFKVDCGLYCGSGHNKMLMTVHVVEK
jgi:cytochrome c oxidase subunit 2